MSKKKVRTPEEEAERDRKWYAHMRVEGARKTQQSWGMVAL